jgi:hypothetical protein
LPQEKVQVDCCTELCPANPMNLFFNIGLNRFTQGVMMPELGRSITHEEGVALVRQWIKEMK